MKQQSELSIITKSKDLCSYVMTVTQKSPRHFRYTYVSRLQNYSLDVIENLFRANDTFVAKGDSVAFKRRLEFQHRAMSSLRLLGYVSMLAMENKCILMKQYEIISGLVSDCQNMLGAWINSDRKRLQRYVGVLLL